MSLCVVSTLSHLKPFNWFTESEIFQRKSELVSKINNNNNKENSDVYPYPTQFRIVVRSNNFKVQFLWGFLKHLQHHCNLDNWVLLLEICKRQLYRIWRTNRKEDKIHRRKICKQHRNIGCKATDEQYIWTHKIKLHKMYYSFFYSVNVGLQWSVVAWVYLEYVNLTKHIEKRNLSKALQIHYGLWTQLFSFLFVRKK